MALVVVIIGACEGVGRATAREFAKRGATVALLASDRARLDATAADVRAAGGEALSISTDVADFASVHAAATAVEQALGPIDVWVNSDLGHRHQTRAALSHMRAHDHGVVVQVESGYPGAAHGIDGFAESHTGFRKNRSGVHVTTVRMPATNAPLPDITARTVVFASEHPERRQHRVGPPPGFTDRFLGGFDRGELRLSAATWLAMRIQSWVWKFEQRRDPN